MKSIMIAAALCLSLVNVAHSEVPRHYKPLSYAGYGVQVKRDSIGIVTVDGHPAARTEIAENGTAAYQSGLFDVVIYANGKAALMKEGVFVGYLKQVKK